MTPKQNLYLAIGELAYAIALADGSIQREERTKFLELATNELKTYDKDIDISGIIFQVLEKDNYPNAETSYQSALKQIKLYSHYLSPSMKETFVKLLTKVAEAFPPATAAELEMLENFKRDIAPLQGDPIYYLSDTK